MSAATSPLEILRQVEVAPRLVEDYRPLTESLEWRLSQQYWDTQGTKGFVQSEVPYTITSSGTLSAQAATLLFENCLENVPEGPIRVLEIGAGTGLFARLFLDEFERLCVNSGKDFFSRLTYYVTDRSEQSIRQWKLLGLFTGRQAVPGRVDGLAPLEVTTTDGPVRLSGLRAVFSNYALDSMPAAVLRNGPDGPEELQVRTHLTTDPERLKSGGGAELQELRTLAENTDPKLLTALQLLEFEAAFRPPAREYPYADEALSFGHDWPRIILNYGATQCLEGALEGLEENGFVLINDYGMTQASDVVSLGASQRFGSSAALGLNFPLLAHHFLTRACSVARPLLDERLPLHPLYLAKRAMPDTERAFHRTFDWEVQQTAIGPQEAARQHIEGGRFEQAREAYEKSLSARPRDWALLGEIAEFLIRHIADYESGRKIAEAALAVNPWYSVWLWNVLGDAVYALERYPEAHDIYLKAEKMEPNDVRTSLNLGYSYLELGRPAEALEHLARGLAYDVGLYRERLLEKQQQILGGIAASHRSNQEWLARRATRLSS